MYSDKQLHSGSQDTVHRFLGWDTSTLQGVVFAAEYDARSKVISTKVELKLSFHAGQHTERLMWAIDQVRSAVDWSLESLSAFVVGVGPGSFTGLRIGITTARTLSMVTKVPVVPVSSLYAMGYPSIQSVKTDVLICSDAAKGEVFIGHWKSDKQTYIEEILPLVAWKEKLKEIDRLGPWVLLGNADHRYEVSKEIDFQNKTDSKYIATEALTPKALAFTGIYAYLEGKQMHYDQLEPNYMRASDAEVQLKAKQAAAKNT